MSPICERVEAALALEGKAALDRDPEIQQHVDGCTECQAILVALSDLDQLLGDLPPIEPPAATVAALFEHPELATEVVEATESAESTDSVSQTPDWKRQLIYSSAAVAALLGLAIGAFLLRSPKEMALEPTVDDLVFGIPDAPPVPDNKEDDRSADSADKRSEDRLRALGYVGGGAAEGTYRVEGAGKDTFDGDVIAEFEARNLTLDRLTETAQLSPSGSKVPVAGPSPQAEPALGKGKTEIGEDKQNEQLSMADEIEVVGELPRISESTTLSTTYRVPPSQEELQARLLGVLASDEENADLGGSFVGGRLDQTPPDAKKKESAPSDPTAVAERFLEELRRTEDLDYQAATGFWSNSYLPGDSAIRLLRARLGHWDRSALEGQAQSSLPLHEAAQAPRHPFDPPRRAAMALYVNANQRQIDGESRVLLQVGLRSTDRRRGQRPAMNVGVVLDFEESPTSEQLDSVRALLFALDEARQPGDRFHLLASGGEDLLGPEDFRRGPLRLFLDDLITSAGKSDSSADPEADLEATLERATDRVARSDDPAAPWGSSSLLLVSDRWLGDYPEFAELARRNAVAGLALSTVALGDSEQAEDLDSLALAGQGRRWWVANPGRATEVARRELEAVGQVVARALRLNISLAPGVRLVEVFDSEPLNAVRAEQVRQSERAVDLRLARNLGIATDRGRDDEGIQIVIPAFQAGDSHVVLLDLLVPSPGTVAEVTLRYKDLVRLRNGTTREQLSLRGGGRQPGPLELSVLRSRLQIELRNGLRQTADRLLDQGAEAAIERLTELRHLLRGLRREVSGLAGDRGLDAELAMVDGYLQALGTPIATDQDWQLAESLRYAGHLCLRPPPKPVEPD